MKQYLLTTMTTDSSEKTLQVEEQRWHSLFSLTRWVLSEWNSSSRKLGKYCFTIYLQFYFICIILTFIILYQILLIIVAFLTRQSYFFNCISLCHNHFYSFLGKYLKRKVCSCHLVRVYCLFNTGYEVHIDRNNYTKKEQGN